TIRFGIGGLDLRVAADAPQGERSGFQRFTNVVHDADGELRQRPGLTALAATDDPIHSIIRMPDPASQSYTRLVGAGGKLLMGTTSLTEIDTGYSGKPVSFVPYRPPISGEPWIFVADENRARKVRADGLVVPIGLSAPTVPADSSAVPIQKTPVIAFDAT